MASSPRADAERAGEPAPTERAPHLLDVRSRWRRQTVATQLMLLSLGVALSVGLVGNAVATLARDRTSARVLRRDALRRAEVAAARLSARLSEVVGADTTELSARGRLRPQQISRSASALAASADSVRVSAGEAGFSGLDASLAELRAIAAAWGRDPTTVAPASVARAREIESRIGRLMRAGVARQLRGTERERSNDASLQTALRLAVLLALLLLAWVIGRAMSRTLGRVIRLAEALSTGEYPAAGGVATAPNLELRQLVDAFDRLALSIAEREQILRSDLLQMKELEQLKNDFISTVSHELRTPLTSMRGALGLLLAGAAGSIDDKARQLTQIAYQNTERLVRLINDILDIEKIEAGHVDMRRESCDVAEVLRATVASLESFALEIGARIVLTTAPAVVVGDTDRLVQLFTNLLSNALKFSPRGGEVGVQVAARDWRAIVRVADQGPGIPPEFQSRIFGKFQQAERPEARRSGGTGLGLAIARAIAEMHGGVIGFETAPGEGTTFIVELPLAAAEPRHAGAAETSGRPRILVVDSDASMLAMLETYFRALGDVTGVRTAAGAREAAARSTYDAVVVDPALPGEDGFQLVRHLRTMDTHASVPVLLFSTREYSPAELDGVVLSQGHVFVKARDREQDLAMRLRAVLTARRVGLPGTA